VHKFNNFFHVLDRGNGSLGPFDAGCCVGAELGQDGEFVAMLKHVIKHLRLKNLPVLCVGMISGSRSSARQMLECLYAGCSGLVAVFNAMGRAPKGRGARTLDARALEGGGLRSSGYLGS
jgi:hypothetical protein